MDLEQLHTLVQCVECQNPTLERSGASFSCPRCGSRWADLDGVPNLRPIQPLPLPRMYDDPNMQLWYERVARERDYVYTGHPVLAWVQRAFHWMIERMSRATAEPLVRSATHPPSPATTDSRNGSTSEPLTLDLGCGSGEHRPYLASAEQTVGLDIDGEALHTLRERHPDFLAVCGDCARLPFRSAVFDRVLCAANLEHLLHLDFALEEVARVLKPDGEFLVTVPTEGGLAWTTGRSLTTAKQFTRDGVDYARSNAIDHCNCVWQVKRAIERHFVIRQERRFPFVIPSYHLNLVVGWRLTPRPVDPRSINATAGMKHATSETECATTGTEHTTTGTESTTSETSRAISEAYESAAPQRATGS
jgi:SAM-dependent methyltransferase